MPERWRLGFSRHSPTPVRPEAGRAVEATVIEMGDLSRARRGRSCKGPKTDHETLVIVSSRDAVASVATMKKEKKSLADVVLDLASRLDVSKRRKGLAEVEEEEGYVYGTCPTIIKSGFVATHCCLRSLADGCRGRFDWERKKTERRSGRAQGRQTREKGSRVKARSKE